jgi:hypothetical protein
MKTSELTGAALDWAVAKCEGEDYCAHDGVDGIGNAFEATRYSTDWSQGGPIIEREGISTRWDSADYIGDTLTNVTWSAAPCDEDYSHTGTTPLSAAMRCYVASKLGDDVDVPEELL